MNKPNKVEGVDVSGEVLQVLVVCESRDGIKSAGGLRNDMEDSLFVNKSEKYRRSERVAVSSHWNSPTMCWRMA